ncbi:MAG TPA: hypothetical protein VEZ71_16610 [Archangium sp.]|nr:hypothetical protein [Archangium sp.]
MLSVRLSPLLPGIEAVVISGSLPPNMTPAQFAGLITRIRERQLPVWIDTSGPALVSGLAARPTGVKPASSQDKQWGVGAGDDRAAA